MICPHCHEQIRDPLADAFELVPHDGLELYEVDGQALFVVYGSDGGLTTSHIFYIFNRESKKVLGVRISNQRGPEKLQTLMLAAVSKFNSHSASFDPDGGTLGLGYDESEIEKVD